MNVKTVFRKSLLGTCWIFLACFATAADFDHTHALLDKVLKGFGHAGLVNYTALQASPAELDGYLDQLAIVRQEDFRTWTENQQLAFLINLYNATTLRLIITHYPVRGIKDIGGALTGPWEMPVVRVFGKKVSLGEIETKMLRKDFDEPAIHLALVRAARGSPELRNAPYVADRLPEQFVDQGRRFLSNPAWNSVDVRNRTIFLSPVFKWYRDDFVKRSGSVLEFVQFYLSPELADALGQGEFKIKYTIFDWSLNDFKAEKQ